MIILNRTTALEKVRLHELRPNDPPLKLKKRGYHNFKVVFGGAFSWRWLVPTVIPGRFTMEELYD